MINLLDYARFHHFSEWLALFVLIAAVLVINRIFRLKYVNALSCAQIIFLFNAIPIIAGANNRILDTGLVAHFFLTELAFMVALCGTYAVIVRQVISKHWELRNIFSGSIPYIMIAVSLSIAVFNYVMTPQDGTSRIMYQTGYWFSLVKPLIEIFTPVSYFAIFVLLLVNKRRIPAYGLLLANIFASIAAGSKGAFVIQAVTAALMLRDLGLMQKVDLRRTDLLVAASGLIYGVFLSLQRLQLNVSNLWDRVMLFGEPTLLTYFAPDPTAACRSLSLLAKMNRGLARMLGDPSALNIDTLFGYAWNIQYLGVNTFTGPNARYSSYMICNFSGVEMMFGILASGLYIVLVQMAVKLGMTKARFIPVIYPFAIFSISEAGQDFNLLMQDTTLLFGIVVVILASRGGLNALIRRISKSR